MPGATQGMQIEDPTIAGLLKTQGYATGQFGKNHLGDRDEHLPTNHGFDEFYGNLYHLNAEDEPEHPDYPKDPAFRERFGPRGVIHSFADGRITMQERREILRVAERAGHGDRSIQELMRLAGIVPGQTVAPTPPPVDAM